MAEVSLETLGVLVQRLLDGRETQGQRLSRIEAGLGEVRDELLVTTAIMIRLEAREVETVGLRALYDRLKRRVEGLEAGR